ncbi:MAG: enoyl-CoA hydratase/isomerase family protein [Microthrixaceae bacterium]
MAQQDFERIRVSKQESRLEITLDWPERRNALDYQGWDELNQALDLAAGDDTCKVVSVTGTDPAFCAGVAFHDIPTSLEIEKTQFPSFIRKWADTADRFERLAQPTVAAINGPAVGAGFEVALAFDIRIASDRALFAMPQLRMGIIPDVGGTSRLAKVAGTTLAKDLVLTGRVLSAEEALAAGIVSRIVPHEDLEAETEKITALIEELPWPAPYFAMVAIDSGLQLDPRRAADLEGIVDQVMLRTDEVWERIDDFYRSKGLKGLRQ